MNLILFILINFSLYIKPGFILDKENKIQYQLQCSEKREKCFFDLELKEGNYVYISSDKTDSVTFVIKNGSVNYLGTQDKDLIIIQ